MSIIDFCRFRWCYQRFILYYREVLKYVDRSDWLPAPPQQKLTDETGTKMLITPSKPTKIYNIHFLEKS